MPKISVYRGRTHLFDHWVEKPEVVIGRSPEVEVPLDSPAASRRHARIVRRAGSYILEELGAKNGVFVNGQFCTIKTLEDGDSIEIADHILVFHRPKSEIKEERDKEKPQAGSAFKIGQHELSRMMDDEKKGDSVVVRDHLKVAGAGQTTAVSPQELERMLQDMKTKLQAHLELLGEGGQHVRHPLEKSRYVLGFEDGVDVRLGSRRLWPWGRRAAALESLPDGSHQLVRLSPWIRIRVNGEKADERVLADKDLIEIGSARLRYLGKADIGTRKPVAPQKGAGGAKATLGRAGPAGKASAPGGRGR
jgi:predicted component of type VI protein secretion system